MKAEHPRKTLQALLATAGLPQDPDAVEQLAGQGALNRHWRVAVAGRALVLREYHWPFPPPAPDRAHHEATVLDLLETEEVPAPRLLAEGDDALLVTFEPGQLLGDLAGDPAADLDVAWQQTGRALRAVHEVVPPSHLYDLLAGGPQRRPLPWHERVVADVDAHLAAMLETRPDLEVDVDRVRRLFHEARGLLQARPLRLLHGDAQPWNVLVDHTDGRWVCSAILDWEFTELGDPLWDLVRFNRLRRHPVGPSPTAFFEGYCDSGPTEVWELYELALHLWQAVDVHAWAQPLPSHRIADEYLTDLPTYLARLEEAVSSR